MRLWVALAMTAINAAVWYQLGRFVQRDAHAHPKAWSPTCGCRRNLWCWADHLLRCTNAQVCAQHDKAIDRAARAGLPGGRR